MSLDSTNRHSSDDPSMISQVHKTEERLSAPITAGDNFAVPVQPASVGSAATTQQKEKAKEFAAGALRRFDQAGGSFVASVVTAIPRFLGGTALTALSVPAAIAGVVVRGLGLLSNSEVMKSGGSDLLRFSKDSVGFGISAMLFTPVDLVMSTVRFLTSWAISPEVKIKEGLTQAVGRDVKPMDIMKLVHKVVTAMTFTPLYITTIRPQAKNLVIAGEYKYPLLGKVKNLLIHGAPNKIPTKDQSDVRVFLQKNPQDAILTMSHLFTKQFKIEFQKKQDIGMETPPKDVTSGGTESPDDSIER